MSFYIFSDNEIKSIASVVEAGGVVFVNKETGFMAEVSPTEAESDDFERKYRDFIEQPELYACIKRLDAAETLAIANRFVWQLSDGEAKKNAVYALSRKDALVAFRKELNMWEPLRRDWFRFKGEAVVQHIKNLLA